MQLWNCEFWSSMAKRKLPIWDRLWWGSRDSTQGVQVLLWLPARACTTGAQPGSLGTPGAHIDLIHSRLPEIQAFIPYIYWAPSVYVLGNKLGTSHTLLPSFLMKTTGIISCIWFYRWQTWGQGIRSLVSLSQWEAQLRSKPCVCVADKSSVLRNPPVPPTGYFFLKH